MEIIGVTIVLNVLILVIIGSIMEQRECRFRPYPDTEDLDKDYNLILEMIILLHN